MCGICGSTKDPDGARVTAMARVLTHRGPDDESFFVDPRGIALGCRRLSIIDVEGGRQPLSNEDGTVWAVLNGEIYNHPELRTQLARAGHTLATRTDTEVLVHLYEQYGDGMVHALEGMFAFAVWDSRRGRLLLARDRYGEKPLFYTERGGHVTFGSELHAVVAGVPGRSELDPAAIDSYFIHGYVPGPESIVKDIRQLPPAHTLSWDLGSSQLEQRRYWQPPRSSASTAEPLPELVAELERLIEASVRSRMIADVPLGVLLSGGVDSSLIAALAAGASSGPLKAFTVGYDVGAVTEVKEAEATARAIGAEHHVWILTEKDVASQVPDVLSRLDQPLADQALVPLHAVSRFAREHVKVAVGGEGADELFGGYPRYRWLWRASRLGEVMPEWAARGGAAALGAVSSNGRGKRMADIILPQSTLRRHLNWVTDRRAAVRRGLYGPRLQGHAFGDPGLNELASLLDGSAPYPGVADMMMLDQQLWLPNDVLAKADRASMLASLEIRTPYLRREVAEFAASVPALLHTRGRGKALLRALLEKVVPEANHRRSKVAFRAPTAEWLRGCLAPTLDEQLRTGAIFDEGWFSRQAIWQLAGQHQAGADHSSVLWPVLTLGLWLDAFEGRASA
jgi:asparagine synthase (glutamine-hydrolysing)